VLTVTFSQLDPRVANGGVILLRGHVNTEYRDGHWLDAGVQPPEAARFPGDPNAPGIKPGGAEFKQSVVCSETLHSRVYFAAGPVSRIGVPRVAMDSEGIPHAADGKPISEPYDIWSYPPVRAENLPEDAEAVHPRQSRYVADGLPPNVRAEVLGYALRITKDDTTTTALKKARSIVAHLRSKRFAYTLDLDSLKRPRDAVADFLLSDDPQDRRGHCGYFASAFVVLCRLNNLPARLACGFAAPLPADLPPNGPQEIVFRDSDAHAWGEVFFKDYGWVAFDPTPAAPTEAHPPSEVVAPPPAPPPPPLPPEPEGRLAGFMGWLQGLWDYVMNYSGKEQRAWADKLATPIREAGSIFVPAEGGGWIAPLVAWVAAVGLVLWLMQAFLRHGRRRGGRLSASAARTQAALAFYNDLLNVLSRRGFVRKPGQTPREFAEHVVRHGGQSFGAVLVVTDVFESVRYGGVEINQDEFNRLQTALDTLRELTFASTQ
jgi:transglutaminase-like putative cysteine protease